jgi:hypothetical protein
MKAMLTVQLDPNSGSRFSTLYAHSPLEEGRMVPIKPQFYVTIFHPTMRVK